MMTIIPINIISRHRVFGQVLWLLFLLLIPFVISTEPDPDPHIHVDGGEGNGGNGVEDKRVGDFPWMEDQTTAAVDNNNNKSDSSLVGSSSLCHREEQTQEGEPMFLEVLETKTSIQDWNRTKVWNGLFTTESPGPGTSSKKGNRTSGSYRIDFCSKPLWEITLAVLSILGNILIVLLICVTPKFRRKTNVLIANLCLASTMYTAAVLIRTLEYKLGLQLDYKTWRLCEVFAILHRFPLPLLSWTTMATSLERSKSAMSVTPFYPPSKLWIWKKILSIWFAAIISTVPSALSNVYDTRGMSDGARKCKKVLILNNHQIHLIYVLFYIMAVFFIPTVMLMIELIRMTSKVKFLVFQRRPQESTHNCQPFISCRTDERLRLVRNACIFTGVFVILWLPIGLQILIYDLPEDILSSKLKFKFLAPMRNVQFIAEFFILSIPLFLMLIMVSDKMRNSCLSCLCSCCLMLPMRSQSTSMQL